MSLFGTKSNDRIDASKVGFSARTVRSASPGPPYSVVVLPDVLGPVMSETFPDDRITPDPNPSTEVSVSVNVPAAWAFPVYWTLLTETPSPARAPARAVAFNEPVRSVVVVTACAALALSANVDEVTAITNHLAPVRTCICYSPFRMGERRERAQQSCGPPGFPLVSGLFIPLRNGATEAGMPWFRFQIDAAFRRPQMGLAEG